MELWAFSHRSWSVFLERKKIKLFYFSNLTIYETRHALNTVFICLSIMFSLCSWNQMLSLFSYQRNHQLVLIDGVIFSYLNLNHFDQIDQVTPRHEYFWGQIDILLISQDCYVFTCQSSLGFTLYVTISKRCKKMYLAQRNDLF